MLSNDNSHGQAGRSIVEIPLSAAQAGIWYAIKAGAPSAGYNIAEYTRIDGRVDPVLFEQALHHVVLEAEPLRMYLLEFPDGPRQSISPTMKPMVTYRDVSSESDPIAAAEAAMRADMGQPPDFSAGPLAAFALFRSGPEQFLWYQRYNHLIMDAYGASLIARRVCEVYSALVAGNEVAPMPLGSYATLIEEDAAYRASPHFQADRQFWRDLMADCPEPPSLSVQATPAAGPWLRHVAELSSDAAAELQDFARSVELSAPQALTMAAAIFIHRLTDAEDVVLGQLMAARMTPVARQTPAMMMNVVPLRLQVRPEMPVRELATQMRRQARAGLRHQRYRIADLRRDLHRVDRPIVRQYVSVRPFGYEAGFAGARGATVPISNGPVEDINVHVVYDGSGRGPWRVEFEANPTLYDNAAVARLLRRFLRLLAALRDPEMPIGRLDLLPPEERTQVIAGWNDTAAGYPRDRRVEELFAAEALRRPNQLAVAFEGQRLRYRDLHEQSDRLARCLNHLGVGPGDRVALHVRRSPAMVVGLLGILKAGGAYVPLDPNLPTDRLAFIAADARPRVVVTEQSLRGVLAAGSAAILCLDALSEPPACPGPAGVRRASDVAYVLYTSGSTGRPKGVQIPHYALVNFLTAMQREPGITENDRMLAVTSLSFDIAALELLLPLLVGAQATIAPAEVAADGFRLATLMSECGATIMQATPATWRLLLETGWEGNRFLKILCGGEAWPPELAAALLPRCASLWNMYGPTETTVWSAVAQIERQQGVLIGRPIANTTFYVLDREDEPVPIGVAGELCIGGDGVACGYLNRPELTAERFIPDPFSKALAARLYRTGDRVRQLPDGQLEFLGRFDHQVKIRGFRVEPGEIEAALRLHPGIRDAVVVAREDRPGEKRLVAYLITASPASVAVASLRELLRQKLPPYMMPAVFVLLDAFPLTPNGKIDRKALPSPDDGSPQTAEASVTPRTPLERLLVDLWRDCLGVEQIGVDDNFFDLGGDSLAMLRLSLQIERATSQTFPLTWIYETPTIAGMAEILGGRKSVAGYSPLVLLRPGDDSAPLFLVHPVGGSTTRLLPIAKALPGRRPVYGIQARGFEGTDEPNDRVEAMAESYVAAIRDAQPHGPYFLGGMCFGGLVAMEIARRLLAEGETIGLLAFLDTYPHPRHWPLRFRIAYLGVRRMREAWAALRSMRPGEVSGHVRALLQKVVMRLCRTESFIQTPDSLPQAVRAVFEGSVTALENYRPRRYPGKVSYLMCGYHAYLPDGPSSVWSHLVGSLDVGLVPAEELGQTTHPEYVANWLVERIEGRFEQPRPPRADFRPSAATWGVPSSRRA
jgi:enterobactin synthetase component F